MECDKCKSENLEVLSRYKGLYISPYTFYEEEYEVIKFKCLDCGYEFEECF